MEVCLACARLEWNDQRPDCPDCGGRLWHPQDVAGIADCTDAELAADLVRRGHKPWRSVPTEVMSRR
jgi:hypothetical protein